MDTVKFVNQDGKVFFECRPAEARIAVQTVKSLRENTDKYWEEEDSVQSDEVGSWTQTVFFWPKDRPIEFERVRKDGAIESAHVPVFLHEKHGGIAANIKSLIAGTRASGDKTFHLHVVHVKDYPEIIGLMTHPAKHTPRTDFFRDEVIRQEKKAKKA
jgi:hypothetical protein